MQRNEVTEMAEIKKIYCPRCGRIACHYNDEKITNPMGVCKKCNKLIIYDICSEEVLVKPVPKRTQGSGMRFY